MNVYDCQDTPFFDECSEDAWGELQRGLIDRNYPGPCMMQAAPAPARERAYAERVHAEQQAQRMDVERQDWYKAREYDRQMRAAENQRRSWMDSYDPMLTAQRFGYTTGPQMAPTVSTQYGAGSVATPLVAPSAKKTSKVSKNNDAENTENMTSSNDLTLGQILNSNVGMLLMLILVFLLFALYEQSRQIKLLQVASGMTVPPLSISPLT